MLELQLGFPPSVNHYYRHVGHRVLISRGGRMYRQAVCALLASHGIRPVVGPLDVRLDLYPPDRRKRDAENSQKALLDALQHGGAFIDDSQIKHLDTWMHEPLPGGRVVVRIQRLQPAAGRDSDVETSSAV